MKQAPEIARAAAASFWWRPPIPAAISEIRIVKGVIRTGRYASAMQLPKIAIAARMPATDSAGRSPVRAGAFT